MRPRRFETVRPRFGGRPQPPIALEFATRPSRRAYRIRAGSGERRKRTLLHHPVYIEIDLLVVETEQVLDLWDLRDRPGIRPHEIPMRIVAQAQGPVARRALVWAMGHCVSRFEKIHPHI